MLHRGELTVLAWAPTMVVAKPWCLSQAERLQKIQPTPGGGEVSIGLNFRSFSVGLFFHAPSFSVHSLLCFEREGARIKD